ncbi:MAG: carbon starvation protein A [Verrucomicrobia bacterium]|nr:carbon starvation protein A [Verrucomicrobiota bacterium]
MSLTLLIIVAVAIFVAAYRWYGRWIEHKMGADAQRATPAHSEHDGVDYVPTKPLILFGHHFSSIAGAGPIVGPIIAGQAFGWVPALLWVLIGSVFIGGVHDYASLIASVRHRARSVGEVCRQYLSPSTYYSLLVFTWIAMVYVIIVFLDLTASSFAPAASELKKEGGAVATASLLYIGLAFLFGLSVYKWKFSLTKGSAIFVPLVFVALWVGLKLPLTTDMVPAIGGSVKNTWSVLLIVYCFVASVLPVWLLLQPRDYLSAYLLFASLAGGALGAVVSGLSGQAAINYPAFRGWSDGQLGLLYPALFITVACGAVSGFHSMVASGTTSKQLDNERSAKPVAYGGMLTEGILAVIALATVMVLAENPGGGRTPVDVFAEGIGKFTSVLGLSPSVGTTFGLLAVSTFLLTTLDTCTRLARFIFEELFRMRGTAGRLIGTAATLLLPTIMVFVAIPGPNGQPIPAWKAIWPAFGATNQLLAAFALLVVHTWLRHEGRKATYIFVPMIFMFITTLIALTQLVYKNLLGQGSVFVGVLSLILFVLALVVLVNALRRKDASRAATASG